MAIEYSRRKPQSKEIVRLKKQFYECLGEDSVLNVKYIGEHDSYKRYSVTIQSTSEINRRLIYRRMMKNGYKIHQKYAYATSPAIETTAPDKPEDPSPFSNPEGEPIIPAPDIISNPSSFPEIIEGELVNNLKGKKQVSMHRSRFVVDIPIRIDNHEETVVRQNGFSR